MHIRYLSGTRFNKMNEPIDARPKARVKSEPFLKSRQYTHSLRNTSRAYLTFGISSDAVTRNLILPSELI